MVLTIYSTTDIAQIFHNVIKVITIYFTTDIAQIFHNLRMVILQPLLHNILQLNESRASLISYGQVLQSVWPNG